MSSTPSIGSPIRIQPDVPRADSPEVEKNPFFAIEDKVTLGESGGLLGFLGFHGKGLKGLVKQNYGFGGSGDRYEPWPKDPKDDFEKQKRREWLKNEIDRLRSCISNFEYQKREKESQAYSLGNEIDSYRNEHRRLGEEYNREDEYRASKEIELGRTKREHREAQERNDSDRAWRLLEHMQRLNDEISRIRDRMYNIQSKRNDLEYRIAEKTRTRESLQNEVYRINENLSRERWTLQEREQEYRNLGGY